MWPNWVKGSRADELNKEPYPQDRPAGRCSFSMAYHSEKDRLVLHGGANAGNLGYHTWEWNPTTNTWTITIPNTEPNPPCQVDNNIGYIPGFGVLEFCKGITWRYRLDLNKWEQLVTQGTPSNAKNSKMVWASKHDLLILWSSEASELWSFDPATLKWEIMPNNGADPGRHYRQGMAYDPYNDAVIMAGGKDSAVFGPWVYEFSTMGWKNMDNTPGNWIGRQGMGMVYDPKYNVIVYRRGDEVYAYRYKKAPGSRISESRSDFNTLDYHVFPNPVNINTGLRLSGITSGKPLSIQVYDINGKLTKFKKYGPIFNNNLYINFRDIRLNPGLYFLKIRLKTKSITKKIVVLN
jgi:hypothetical protein